MTNYEKIKSLNEQDMIKFMTYVTDREIFISEWCENHYCCKCNVDNCYEKKDCEIQHLSDEGIIALFLKSEVEKEEWKKYLE